MRLFLPLLQGWPILGVHVTKKKKVLGIVAEGVAKIDFTAQPKPGWALVPCDAAEEFILPSAMQARSNEISLMDFEGYTIPDAEVIAVVLTNGAYAAWAKTDAEKSYLPGIDQERATHIVVNFIRDHRE